MLTKKPSDTPAASAHGAPGAAALEDLTCYFEGRYVALRDAKVSIMTHAFMYGTATFEGIRAYWNAQPSACPTRTRARWSSSSSSARI